MQMALPAPIYPPIDSILHRLELICRPVWFFFWLPHSLWTPQSALNRGGRKKKKHVTAQRWWLKDRYHFYNSKFPWQHYSGLMPPEGLQQFLCSEQMAAFFLSFFRHVALDLFWLFSCTIEQNMFPVESNLKVLVELRNEERKKVYLVIVWAPITVGLYKPVTLLFYIMSLSCVPWNCRNHLFTT